VVSGSITPMKRKVSVVVGEDHLAGFKRSPRLAISELIWNALDADATDVKVDFELTLMDSIDTVTFRDKGTGMTDADAEFAFRNFGNSWKRSAAQTLGGRKLHGKLGRGRYTAFAIGTYPKWVSVAVDEGSRKEITIAPAQASLKNFEIESRPAPEDEPVGTTLTIANLTDNAQRDLLRSGIWEDLSTRFAPYLDQYPLVNIAFRGNPLKPETLRERTGFKNLFSPAGDFEVHITEWKVKVDRRLFLCDENGWALADLPVGIQTPGYQNFTAYIRWPGFKELGHDIIIAEMDDGEVGRIIERSKDAVREYFRERAAEKQKEIVEGWKADGAYPYKDKPLNSIQVAERQAFDVVAISAASVVNEGTTRSRKIALRLIRTALESGESTLQDILLNVLELPAEKVADLKQLLARTTLSNVIEASKKIADRLEFIAGLDALIFDKESKKQTLERRQLHRILTTETWIFGEEWALTGDDDRLTQVLATHLGRLGKDVELASVKPVLRADGRDAIPDLVLSRTLETSENKYEHLVVELKRPSHVLTSEDIEQIRSYALAVAEDDRFAHPNTHWDYVLIGNSTNTSVDDQREQPDQPFGRVQRAKRYTIWVRTWSEIIGDAKHRHKFIQQSLDYTADHDSGIDYLRERHNQFLPDVMQPDSEAKDESESVA